MKTSVNKILILDKVMINGDKRRYTVVTLYQNSLTIRHGRERFHVWKKDIKKVKGLWTYEKESGKCFRLYHLTLSN